MKRDFDFRAHEVGIVHGRPWKDAVIKLLEPRSPYRPWRTDGSLADGQMVVVVLDTDPQSVLTALGVIGADGDIDHALAEIDRFRLGGLLELSTLKHGHQTAAGARRVRPRFGPGGDPGVRQVLPELSSHAVGPHHARRRTHSAGE